MSSRRENLWMALVCAGALGCDPRAEPPEAWIGAWSGVCPMIVSWSSVDESVVSYDIGSDGTVAGSIGDARIENGRLEFNDVVSTTLGAAPFLIRGALAGPLDDEANIVRDTFTATVDATGDTLDTTVTSNFTVPTPDPPSVWDEWKCGPALLERVR